MSRPRERVQTYRYRGEAASQLVESYQSDKDPFWTRSPEHPFPERPNGFQELSYMKGIFFPHYWNNGEVANPDNQESLETQINELGQLFLDGMMPYVDDSEVAKEVVDGTLDQLPVIREKLKKDVDAAYREDPAAKDYSPIIRAYPGFQAIEAHRVTHELHKRGSNAYARELQEHVHSKTGIDINPGAEIGEYFFIDHGTKVVIGETATIGDHVRLYHGVTLGVLQFDEEATGALRKEYKRHPDIGNHVVIGADATLLGPITVGDHVNIGARSWIIDDVRAGTTIFVGKHPEHTRKDNRKNQDGGGI